MRQGEWVTRMARLAATDFGADWVINADADEFWWPRGGSLKEVLAAVPDRYGDRAGCWRHFLPRPDDGGFFAERMTVRLCAPASPGDKRTIFHAHQKVAHRARAGVKVERGNHDVIGDGLEPLRGWHPIEVLHFSFRSPQQAERKCRGGAVERRQRTQVTLHQQLLYDACRRGRRSRSYYDSFVVDGRCPRAWHREGTLAVDTRLRDALRVAAWKRRRVLAPGRGSTSRVRAPGDSRTRRTRPRPPSSLTVDGIVARRGASGQRSKSGSPCSSAAGARASARAPRNLRGTAVD